MAEKFPDSAAEPSDPSTIRILLLGRCGSGKSSSGNTILGQNVFKSPKRYKEKVTRTCEEHSCDVTGRKVCVIDTPDLLDSDLTEDQLNQEKDKLLSLCQSGLHAVLLVVPIGEDLQNEEKILEFSKGLFGPNIQDYTITLFTHGDNLEEGETIEKHTNSNLKLKQLIDECYGHYHVFKNRHPDENQVEELLDKIDSLVKNNEGTFSMGRKRRNSVDAPMNFSGECFESCSELNKESTDIFEQLYGSQSQLRMVLIGKTGAGKSSSGNTILGKNLFRPSSGLISETKECSLQRVLRGGREIVVVDTPGLFDDSLSTEDVKKEIVKCLTFISPGPHVFLIVIRIGRFTPEEFETIRQLEEIFGSEAAKYTMILFTHQDSLENETIEDHIQNCGFKLREFIRKCGNSFHCFNNKKPSYPQLKKLLSKIDEMSKNAGPECYYTNEVFKRAEKEIRKIQKNKFDDKISSCKEKNTVFPSIQTIWKIMQESRVEAEQMFIVGSVCIIIFMVLLGTVRSTRNLCVIQ